MTLGGGIPGWPWCVYQGDMGGHGSTVSKPPPFSPSPCLFVDTLGRRPGHQKAITQPVGAGWGGQIYRTTFTWEDIQRYLGGGMCRPSGLLVCGGRGEVESRFLA